MKGYPNTTIPSHPVAMTTNQQPSSSSTPFPPTYDQRWGTPIMMTTTTTMAHVPTGQPNDPKAALWGVVDGDHHHHQQQQQQQQHHSPYLQYNPVEKPTNTKEAVLHKFSSWTNKANSAATNIWHNLKTGPSVSGAAWDKVNVTAKAMTTEGGFESLYKQSFATFPNEKLNKSFACYISTPTGPVGGTLYLSNLHMAFCSDTPLSFTSSAHQTWSYYKVIVPLGKLATINPLVMTDNKSEKYIQIVTVDGHDFWFMGFVNYEKASKYLTDSICSFVAPGVALRPPAVA